MRDKNYSYMTQKSNEQIGYVDFSNTVVDYQDGDVVMFDHVEVLSKAYPLKPKTTLIGFCSQGQITLTVNGKTLDFVSGDVFVCPPNVKEIEKRIAEGDAHAEMILNAMIYHVAKNIVGLGAVFCGKVDAILLTGGLARSEYVITRLRKRIEFLAPTYCFPGEDEMEALALNALAVLRGKREVKIYT